MVAIEGSAIVSESRAVIDSQRLQRIKVAFEAKTGLSDVDYEVRTRTDGDILVILLAAPTERLHAILDELSEAHPPDELFPSHATIEGRQKKNLADSAEARLLLRVLSESLTISRHSLDGPFLDRYTRSVSGAEEQVVAQTNNVVYGRRGSGKSSLLLYAVNELLEEKRPSIWFDMQAYSHRSDHGVSADVLLQLVCDLEKLGYSEADVLALRSTLATLADRRLEDGFQDVQALVPRVRRFVGGRSD